MSEDTWTPRRNKSLLDPRTKLLLIFVEAVLVLATTGGDRLFAFRVVFAILPFLLLLTAKRYMTCIVGLLVLGSIYFLEYTLFPYANGALASILLIIIMIINRFLPAYLTGVYVVGTTTVSEFKAAMDKLHMPDALTIPMCVMFRLFPTIREESRKDAGVPCCPHDHLYGEDRGRTISLRTHERTWETKKTDEHLPYWIWLGGLGFLSSGGSDRDLLDIGGARMIEFENVSFTYEATPGQKSLRDFSLSINDGECILITGPSGCGKSTLLRLLNGLIPEFYSGETEGSIKIDGNEIQGSRIEDQAGRIGTVFQNPRSQFFNVDTTSELAFGPENLGLSEGEILDRIGQTVKAFHIGALMDRSIFELSGGEKQKIACASVDVLAPGIILLDEPSANLDYEAAENLRELILCWKNAGKTILIAEHRINYIWDLADRVVIMENGVLTKEIQRDEIGRFTEEDATRYGLRCLERIDPTSLVKAGKEAAEQNRKDNTIILKNFRYSYDKRQELYSIPEMKIRKGKVTAIVGANGAGKTTFLESICSIRKNNGIMEMDGIAYSGKKRIGMIFMVMQDVNHQLFTESVLDEVLISQRSENEEEAKKILSDVGLAGFSDRHPMSLSGGQKQRLALACAIASKLPILLLDEPTSGLDLLQMHAVAEILNRLKEEGRTVITVTHDSEFIECCCDDVIRMEEAQHET